MNLASIILYEAHNRKISSFHRYIPIGTYIFLKEFANCPTVTTQLDACISLLYGSKCREEIIQAAPDINSFLSPPIPCVDIILVLNTIPNNKWNFSETPGLLV